MIFVVPASNAQNSDQPSKELLDLMEKNKPTEYSGYSSKPQTTVSSEDISKGIDNTIFFSSPDSPLRIKKTFSPGNKSNYLLGDPIAVYVEISSTDEDLSDSYILEVIDDDLCVVPVTTEFGKISSIDSLMEYYRDLNNDEFLESGCSINNSAFATHVYNRSGANCKKEEREYNLINLKLNDSNNLTELNNIEKSIGREFKIPSEDGKLNIFNIQKDRIQMNRSEDLDFIDIIIKDNKSAIIDISGDRRYEYNAKCYNNSIIINETEVALKFDIQNLSKKELFVYKYYIKPKKSGIFNTVTLVRSWGRSDTRYVSTIDVKDPDPKFEINPRLKETSINIPFDKKLELVYDITYLGGASEPDLFNAKIKLENDMDYYDAKFNNDKQNQTINLTKYKTAHLKSYIIFKEHGVFSVPGIYINGKLFNFKDTTIVVNDFWDWITSLLTFYNILFTSIIAVIFFLIPIIGSKTPQQFIRDKLISLLTRINNFIVNLNRNGQDEIVFRTSIGHITIKFNNNMPEFQKEFVRLIKNGLYGGTDFINKVDAYTIEGGNNLGKAQAKPNIKITEEVKDQIAGNGKNRNERGTLSIIFDKFEVWDGQISFNLVHNSNYNKVRPVLGRVVEGMDVVDAISRLKTYYNQEPIEKVIFYN